MPFSYNSRRSFYCLHMACLEVSLPCLYTCMMGYDQVLLLLIINSAITKHFRFHSMQQQQQKKAEIHFFFFSQKHPHAAPDNIPPQAMAHVSHFKNQPCLRMNKVLFPNDLQSMPCTILREIWPQCVGYCFLCFVHVQVSNARSSLLSLKVYLEPISLFPHSVRL